MTCTDTLNASERTLEDFLRARPITVRAPGYRTAARHLNNYPFTNRIPPTRLARLMPFLRAISALDSAVMYNKHLKSVS